MQEEPPHKNGTGLTSRFVVGAVVYVACLWLLPLVPARSVEQPQRSSEAVQARILKTIIEEETELLDEELLDLMAVGQK